MKIFIPIFVSFIFLLSSCGQGAKTTKAEVEAKTETKTEAAAKTEGAALPEGVSVEGGEEMTMDEATKRQKENPTPEAPVAPHPDAKMPAGSDESQGGLLGAKEFAQVLATKPDAQLIDVRTPGEFKQGHLAHASNIDIFNPKFQEEVEKLDKAKPVFIYCRSGGRSNRALKMLEGWGFSNVFDMRGGIGQWQAQGLPTVK